MDSREADLEGLGLEEGVEGCLDRRTDLHAPHQQHNGLHSSIPLRLKDRGFQPLHSPSPQVDGLYTEEPDFLLAFEAVQFAADEDDEVGDELAKRWRIEGDDDGNAQRDQ